MNLNTVLLILAVLVCPITMSIMMWRMNKNMDDRQMHMKSNDSIHSNHTEAEEHSDSTGDD